MKKILMLAGLLLLVPVPTLACGGVLFDIAHVGMYVAGILTVIHCLVFFVLSSKLEIAKRAVFATRYSIAMLHLHFSFPALMAVLTSIAHACIESRSVREIYLDGLTVFIVISLLISAIPSGVVFIIMLSKKLTAEHRIKLGKILAVSLDGITAVVFFYLAYALWVVAPTLSSPPPALPPYL
jgi:hypothetical protein